MAMFRYSLAAAGMAALISGVILLAGWRTGHDNAHDAT